MHFAFYEYDNMGKFDKPRRIETKKLITDVFRKYCATYKSDLDDFCHWDMGGYVEDNALVGRFMATYKDCSLNPQNVTLLENVNVKLRYGCSEDSAIEGLIIDHDTKTLYFVEAKRIKNEPTVWDDETYQLFKIREEIYVGKGDFCGINLFEYDAYAVFLADMRRNYNEWTRKIAAKDWNSDEEYCKGYDFKTLCGLNIDSGLVEIVDDYCLTYSLMPFFDSQEYAEEVERKLQSLYRRDKPDWSHPQEILVYADDGGFEGLLAIVNTDERFKDQELLK